MPAAALPQRKFFGILLFTTAVGCFALGDTGTKWLNAYTTPALILLVRYLFSFVLVTGVLRPWRDPRRFTSRKPGLQVLRGVMMLGATACGWTALHYITVMQVTSIVFAAPLIIVLLAGPVLGEWPGLRRIIAVLVGFLGVLVITRPWSGDFPLMGLLAIGTAILNGSLAIVTRKLAPYDDSETTMFYSTTVGAILVLPVFFFAPMPPPDVMVWIVLGLVGFFGTAAHWFLVVSHRHAPASTLAPFFYTQILFAAAASFAVFGNLPDRWTIAGASIIVASGLYILHRERIKHVPPSADIAE